MSVDAILKSEIVRNVFKGVNLLVNEARIHLTQEELHIRAVEFSNIAMVIARVPKDSFEAYKVEENTTVGVDVARINDFVSKFKKEELVDMSITDGRLKIGTPSIKYQLSLIDPTAIRKEPKVPNLDLPAKVVLDSAELKKFIALAEKISDQVLLRTDEEGFHIEAEGDVDRLALNMSDAELINFNGAEASSYFAIEWLKEFTKLADPGRALTIRLGKNMPGWFTFECEHGETVEFVLAPRIEVE
jgi:proliferating cell nuclear antigen